jgi:hypothetical protein
VPEREISPNDLFGVSDSIDGEVLRLGPWALKTARKLQELPQPMRQSVETLLHLELSTEMMRTNAHVHADQARRHIGQLDLAT